LKDQAANLPDLIRLGHVAILLEVCFLDDSRLTKHVVTTARSQLETKMKEQIDEIVERDVGIAFSLDNSTRQFFPFSHMKVGTKGSRVFVWSEDKVEANLQREQRFPTPLPGG
jgi:hypothetical protein